EHVISSDDARISVDKLTESLRKTPEGTKVAIEAVNEAGKAVDDFEKQLDDLADNPWTKELADDAKKAEEELAAIWGQIASDAAAGITAAFNGDKAGIKSSLGSLGSLGGGLAGKA